MRLSRSSGAHASLVAHPSTDLFRLPQPHQFVALTLCIFLYCVPPAVAAGPRFVINGQVLRWLGGDLRFRIQVGTLPGLSSEQVRQAILDAAKTWNDVRPTNAPVLVFEEGPTPNLATRIEFEREQRPPAGDNLVLFDVAGVHVKDGVLAQTTVPFANTATGPRLGRFVIIVTGTPLEQQTGRITAWTEGALRAVMVHEFGHAIGLDHSQLPRRVDPDPDPERTPAMFPELLRFDGGLRPDDIASFLALYASEQDLLKLGYGRIQGSVSRQMMAFPGVNVIAELVPNGPEGTVLPALEFASVSGYLDLDGEYSMWVRPGRYRLLVQAIEYVGPVSGIGPDARRRLAPRGDVRDKEFADAKNVAEGATVVLDFQLDQ